MTTATVNTTELEAKVKEMYRDVAAEPLAEYHFELGRPLAEHLGYPPELLDRRRPVPDTLGRLGVVTSRRALTTLDP